MFTILFITFAANLPNPTITKFVSFKSILIKDRARKKKLSEFHEKNILRIRTKFVATIRQTLVSKSDEGNRRVLHFGVTN